MPKLEFRETIDEEEGREGRRGGGGLNETTPLGSRPPGAWMLPWGREDDRTAATLLYRHDSAARPHRGRTWLLTPPPTAPATQGLAAAASTPLVAYSRERCGSLQRYHRHETLRKRDISVSVANVDAGLGVAYTCAAVKCWSSKKEREEREQSPPSPDSQMRVRQTWVSRVMRAPATLGTSPPRLQKNVKNRSLAEKSIVTHTHPRPRRRALLAEEEKKKDKRRRRRRRRRRWR